MYNAVYPVASRDARGQPGKQFLFHREINLGPELDQRDSLGLSRAEYYLIGTNLRDYPVRDHSRIAGTGQSQEVPVEPLFSMPQATMGMHIIQYCNMIHQIKSSCDRFFCSLSAITLQQQIQIRFKCFCKSNAHRVHSTRRSLINDQWDFLATGCSNNVGTVHTVFTVQNRCQWMFT